MKPAVFLDRDGVINKNHGYVYKKENFDFIDGIFDFVKKANKENYLVVIVTNQAGIARGYYAEEDFHKLTKWMCNRFADEGITIDKVYFSPFHPTEGIGKYLKDDISRKPNPGMILQAQSELNINLNNSILIGDKESDIKAGIAAGIKKNILYTPNTNDKTSLPCIKIRQLDEAIKYIDAN